MSEDSAFYEELAAGFYDPLRFILWAFPWGESPEFSLVELPEPWASRYPNCKYGPDRWVCELLDRVAAHVQKNDFDGKHSVPALRMAVASGHGIGKALRTDSVVDTPSGKRRWGDLKVGDYLWGPDGKPTRIVDIPFRGKAPFYRVTFDDGSSTVCSSGHLWTVQGRQQRRYGQDEWITLETQQILELGVKRKNGVAMAKQWKLPKHQPVEYPEADLPVDPYLLGLVIGNGHVNKNGYGTVTVSSLSVMLYLEEFFCFSEQPVKYKKGWTVIGLPDMAPYFRATGLCGVNSSEKFIPDEYKYASVEQRAELFRGLVDSDGEVTKQGTLIYSTTSWRLRDDVLWLARSLGGKAQVHPTAKKAWYYDENRNRVPCKECYRITLTMPRDFVCGYYKERVERIKPTLEDRYLSRFIESIEPVGEMEGMCVTVDREDGLFLANDFIVTHNSAATAMIATWLMATRPNSKGVVTANTAGQLETKTFAEIKKWLKRSIVADLFDIKAMSIEAKEAPESWRLDAITCREENAESFAGQHAASSSSYYLMDEASAVPDVIWEVAEGGLTDGEPFMFVFGNPTRNTGRFRECFGKRRERWITKQIDSRTVAITNKEEIAAWEQEYGEDSDFFRVRVRGVFPSASSMQFIPTALAEAAAMRPPPARHYVNTAILGVDVARFGDDSTVLAVRFGRDASMPFKCYKGLSGDKVIALVKNKIHELKEMGFKRVYCMMDEGAMGGAIVDVLKADGYPVRGVSFAQSADEPEVYNRKREEMWGRMKKWLHEGSIPNDRALIDDLTGVEYGYNERNVIKLEKKEDMKKRGLPSPDRADALCLTFSYRINEYDDDVMDSNDGPVIRDFDPIGLYL